MNNNAHVFLKFKSHHRGLCRTYYTEVLTEGLYCQQPGPDGRPMWFSCSKDGEPSMDYLGDVTILQEGTS